MDLMKGSTSFRSLRKKYDDFSAPSVEVTVGSTKLVSGAGADIFDLELELTSGFEASGCVFYIDGAYDEKNTDFKKFTDKIQIGESVEIALGYVRRESVFKGYINEVEYQYGMEDDRNRIRVECMDAKGLLMKTRRMEIFTQKSADAVVKAILGETPVSSYISGKEIDSCKEEVLVIRSCWEIPDRSSMSRGYRMQLRQKHVRRQEWIRSASGLESWNVNVWESRNSHRGGL